MNDALKPIIVVHGGAGQWQVSETRLDEAMLACTHAVEVGQRILLEGGLALDAVEAAVRVLEDSPVLDAGRGSYLNSVGEIEMDALIMDGKTMDLGAVAAIQHVRNPISLARLVMTNSNHNFLVGAGAEQFADDQGFPRCAFSELLPPEHPEQNIVGGDNQELERQVEVPGNPVFGDTVGAVALDLNGNLAAATSTGGTKAKLPGRVGDSPLVGSGAYADNWTAAVSATGYGEALMKVLISKRVCDFVADGLSTQKACESAIDVLHERVDGQGGVISVDIRGRIGIAYNTKAMPHAHAVGDSQTQFGS